MQHQAVKPPGVVPEQAEAPAHHGHHSVVELVEDTMHRAAEVVTTVAGEAAPPTLVTAAHAFEGPEGHNRPLVPDESEAIAQRHLAAVRAANERSSRTSTELILPQGSWADVLEGNGAVKGSTVTLKVDQLHLKDARDERKLLVDYALQTLDQDNGPLLKAIHDRLARVGMAPPTVEVAFKGLSVDASVNVGSRGMPTVFNFFRGKVEFLLRLARLYQPETRPFNILHDVSGVLKPGRLTLLLGPPSSGKSTLLKLLAGVLREQQARALGLDLKGSVTYNGENMDQFEVRRTASYVEQVDNHLGELTVRETMDFAARCLGVGHAPEMLEELRRREKAAGVAPDPIIDGYMRATAVVGGRHSLVTQAQLQLLGLDVCADTVVGGQMLRGVSGGQKKRVTLGEMMVGPHQVLLLDEVSTGLDASTTRLITQCFRNMAHLQQATILVALLQPPPEVYDLFDDIMLLSDGRVVFHGPKEEVLPFFKTLGFAPPERKGVADFLQEVTSRADQATYWLGGPDGRTPYSYVPVEDMVLAFEASAIGRQRSAALSHSGELTIKVNGHANGHHANGIASSSSASGSPAKRSDPDASPSGTAVLTPLDPTQLTGQGAAGGASKVDTGASKVDTGASKAQQVVPVWTSDTWPCDSLTRTQFALSGWQAFQANLLRDYTLMTRLGFLWGFKTFQALFTGIIFSTLFLHSRMGHETLMDGSLYLAIIFYSITHSMFNGYVEMSILVQGLRTFFKQRNARFFPPWTYTLPPVVLRIPFSLLDATIWAGLIYWVTGMAPSAGRFFIFLVYMFLMSQMALALFRAIGALTRNYDTANSFGSTALILLLLLSGFILNKSNIPPWWIWAFWMSPITYTQQALSINELSHPRWNTPIVFRGQEMPVGEAVLENFGLFKDRYFVWLGAVVLIGYTILFQVLAFCFLTWFNEPVPPTPVVSDEFLEARDANIKGGALAARVTAKELEKAMSERAKSERIIKSASAGNLSGYGDSTPTTPMANGGGSQAGGMALPFTPTVVSFHNMCYSVDMTPQHEQYATLKAQGDHKPQLKLLTNITGSFRPGVLTALMGVSGAGKTTLMDVLAGRKTTGTITGDMRVDGFPVNQDTFARVCGYVEQADIHVPRTTVREAIYISGRLRLNNVKKEKLDAFVDEVMALVELGPQAGALVGLPGQFGLSVEQRKRLTIGVELVANPAVVFMDEPTSGLDARAAAIVMRAVRNTVNTGRTVVCTIHQPSIDIFESFDELLLLKRGGFTIFHGAVGDKSCKLIEYFQSFPGVPHCPVDLNPATWMLEVTTPAEEGRLGVDFSKLYLESNLFKYNEDLVAQLAVPKEGAEPISFKSGFAHGRWTQFKVLLKRNLDQYWRNPSYNGVRYMFTGFLGVMLGCIFYQLGQKRETPTDVFNVMGALFICITFLGTYNASGVLPVLAAERPVFYRERAAKMYDALPYALSLLIVEIPYIIAQSILYGAITYFMIKFELEVAKFFWYLLFVFLTLLFFTCYGFMITSLMPIVELSAVISSMFYSLWFVLGGFFISEPNMPRWWAWLYWVDPLSYALYGIIGSQLSDVTDEYVDPGTGAAPVSVADYVKDTLNYNRSFVGPAAIILAGFIVAFWLIFVYAVTRLNHNKR